MLFMNVFHDITRNKVQSSIIIIISFLFNCFIGIYLGSIYRNNILLNTLGERLPVKVMLVDKSTGEELGLKITEKQIEKFSQLDIIKTSFTAECYGNFGSNKQNEIDKRISMYINAANDISIFALSSDKISMDKTEINKILKSDEAVCFLDKDYMKDRGVEIEIGETLDIALFQPIYDDLGFANNFSEVGNTKIKVAGLYWGTQNGSKGNFPNMICPIKWLDKQYKAGKLNLTYTSAKGIVDNPLELNYLKEKAKKLKFGTLNISMLESHKGVALAVDDRLFIQTATKIQQNIRLLQFFKYPIVIILFFLEILMSFIIIKKQVYNIYLVRCLGEKSIISIIKLSMKMLILSFFGGIAASTLLVVIQYINWINSINILIKFLFVCLVGTIIPSIIYLRMNLIKLFQQIN